MIESRDNLSETTYISIGTDRLYPELWRLVQRPQNNFSFKPRGGLWCSPFYGESGNVCDWLNFLQENTKDRMWRTNDRGVLLHFKPETKICSITSVEQLRAFAKKYPSLHHRLCYCNPQALKERNAIDYEWMSDDYDGVYVAIDHFPSAYLTQDKKATREFSFWGCNTLLIFHPECIDSYYPVILKCVRYGRRSSLFCTRNQESTKNS